MKKLLQSISFQQTIYNTAIAIYGWAIRIAALRNTKAKQFLEGRKGLFNHLKQDIVLNENYVWFHCASLGEFEQGRPLLEKIRKALPHLRVVLTFFSPSGFEVRKDYQYADEIYYLPLDTPKNASEFVKTLQPKLAIFVKYEFWYNFISSLKAYQIPIILLSASFRPEQVFFKPWASLFRNLIHQFDQIFVQDGESGQLLQGIGYNQYRIIPDTRIDRVYEIMQATESYPEIENFTANYKVIVGGSVYKEETDWLFNFSAYYDETLRVILAPHDTSEDNINRVMGLLGNKAVRYSQMANSPANDSIKFLVVDQIGLLASLYRYGDIAVIGGGFRKSIHNTLEPATFGLPMIFGPNYQHFNEAKDLVAQGGAFTANNYQDFRSNAEHLLQANNSQQAGEICKNYIDRNRGGTNQVFEYITHELTIPEIRHAPNPSMLDDIM